MSRSLQNPSLPNPASRTIDANSSSLNSLNTGTRAPGLTAASRITALNIEFVAKPNEAHKVHAALPPAINGALGEVAGFAGSFVMIADHEARLVTVVTLWVGEDRLQHCHENVRWVRALVAPYLDRCLRIQTLAAYVPGAARVPRDLEESCSEAAMDACLKEEPAMRAA